jgi:hypothetical protein
VYTLVKEWAYVWSVLLPTVSTIADSERASQFATNGEGRPGTGVIWVILPTANFDWRSSARAFRIKEPAPVLN